MQGAALAELARDDARFSSWRYDAFDVEPERLGEALGLMAEKGFLGVNLTVPHKVQAVGLVAGMETGAREAGAVNTLVLGAGGWHGHNTDGYGLSAAIAEDLGLSLRGTPVILIGAGGAARGAAVECLRAGCAGIWIVNRSRPNLDTLLGQLRPLAPSTPLHGVAPGLAAPALPKGALVVNATSAGLHPSDPAPIDLDTIPGPAAVFDMVYNPPRTRLLARAEALGIPCANGLAMLVHQGAKALEIWSGVPAARTAPVMRSAAAKALGSK
jgi:shikimate dehydrogenase